MDRKWVLKGVLLDFVGWSGISEHYRDRKGCIMYLSEDRQDIYVDIPFDDEWLSSDDSVHRGVGCFRKTPLLFMMADYLRITKVMLRSNKRARRWFNNVVKNNFHYAGRLFKEYFLPDGRVDWTLVIEAAEITLPQLEFIMKCDGIKWNGYDPLRDCKEYQEDDPTKYQ